MIPSDDVGFGLMFGYQNPTNYHLFAIDDDGYYTIAAIKHGELNPLHAWQQFPHIRRGVAQNRLRVRCFGTSCRFFINDEFAVELEIEPPPTGDLGLWAQTFSGYPLEVVFEKVRVWLSS
jgi:hypothetical protein